jgi:hypothetical protein
MTELVSAVVKSRRSRTAKAAVELDWRCGALTPQFEIHLEAGG